MRIEKNDVPDKRFEVTVSMIEIYNEAVQVMGLLFSIGLHPSFAISWNKNGSMLVSQRIQEQIKCVSLDFIFGFRYIHGFLV